MHHLVEIPETNLKRYFPQTLADCNPQQYMDMCELIYMHQTEQITFEQLKLIAVYKLLNIKQSKKKLSEEDEILKWANLNELSNIVDSFFETSPTGQKTIIQNYIHNPIPSIALWNRYYGPTDNFLNIKFGEYVDALRLFQEFPKTNTTKHLYLIAAILYRKKKPFHFIKKRQNNYDGDIRIAYNAKIVDKNALKMQHLPIGFVYGVYLLLASFQKFITTAQIPWGGRIIDFSILFDAKENKNEIEDEDENEPASIGMDSLIFSIAESGEFGNADAVRNTDMWEILIRLYDIRKKDLDQQKELDKQKTNDKPTQP